jgi:hypothetical protein
VRDEPLGFAAQVGNMLKCGVGEFGVMALCRHSSKDLAAV